MSIYVALHLDHSTTILECRTFDAQEMKNCCGTVIMKMLIFPVHLEIMLPWFVQHIMEHIKVIIHKGARMV